MLVLNSSWYLYQIAKPKGYFRLRPRSCSRCRMDDTAVCPLVGNIHRDLSATARSLFHVCLWIVLDSRVGVGGESWR